VSTGRIASVSTTIIDVPLRRPHKFSVLEIDHQSLVLVRIRTTERIKGIGEGVTPGGPWWGGESVETMKPVIDRYLAPIAIGRDVGDIQQLRAAMDKQVSENRFAKAALEIALYDAWGKRWEYPKNKTGRLMLLEFWQSDDGPSLELIASLKAIPEQYAGLEVVSVAYETAEQETNRRMAVRGVASRYGIKYRLLMGGGPLTGGAERCPVAREFRIDRVPTLLLINESGREVWRSREGIDERQLRELRQAITRNMVE